MRNRSLRWLRRAHGWLGLWGATLGLLFGASGFLLNHRAVLKIPAAQMPRNEVVVAAPAGGFADPAALERWLRAQFAVAGGSVRARAHPAQAVAWGDQSVQQPARLEVGIEHPRALLSAEYWAGAGTVKVMRADANFWSAITRLHKGSGQSVPWVLLADTIAGSLVLLSLSGILMWTRLERRRLLIAGGATGGFVATILAFAGS